jgi:CDP-6-deoxy-D-xylo-4-hexulose-3-dehydrase
MQIVKDYGLILLEDCCDALGSTYRNQPLGSFGEMASCSFYPAHHITMGEGGFVASSTDMQDTVVKSLREWGRGCYCSGRGSACLRNGMCKKRFSAWLPDLPDTIFDHKYVYEEIGYNLKPLDLQAAMGLVQINRIAEFSECRKKNFLRLKEVFSKYEDVFHIPNATPHSDPSWFAFPLTVKDGVYMKRSDFTMYLEDHKIQTRNYFGGNLLLQPAYSGLRKRGNPIKKFPNATKVTMDTFFIGTSQVVTDVQIDYIKTVVDAYFEKARNIRV